MHISVGAHSLRGAQRRNIQLFGTSHDVYNLISRCLWPYTTAIFLFQLRCIPPDFLHLEIPLGDIRREKP